MCFLSHSFVALAVCFGSLSCWNTQTRPIFTTHGVLGVIGSIPPPPNTVSWVDAKELDFDLIWPQHFHPVSESLANLRRTYTCAFLSRETLRALQDFSPSRRSVTNCFLADYGSSCIEFIDKILPCSSGLVPHRSHDHWNSTRWDLAWSPGPREIDSFFLCFFHSRIIAPTVVTFSPSCLPMVL